MPNAGKCKIIRYHRNSYIFLTPCKSCLGLSLSKETLYIKAKRCWFLLLAYYWVHSSIDDQQYWMCILKSLFPWTVDVLPLSFQFQIFLIAGLNRETIFVEQAYWNFGILTLTVIKKLKKIYQVRCTLKTQNFQ